eukprot:589666-Hanusia_phi.AAC.1
MTGDRMIALCWHARRQLREPVRCSANTRALPLPWVRRNAPSPWLQLCSWRLGRCRRSEGSGHSWKPADVGNGMLCCPQRCSGRAFPAARMWRTASAAAACAAGRVSGETRLACLLLYLLLDLVLGWWLPR